MSDFEQNPFADPTTANPFADPSVQSATRTQAPQNAEFNPFAAQNTTQVAGATQPAAARPPNPQPAVMQPTEAPPAYTASPAQNVNTDDLQKRQEELERKAAELQRKEQEMRAGTYNARQNNWPPLPKFFPIGPCFYQDFEVDIPAEFQRIVKTIYYLWGFYTIVLMLNLLGSLAYFIAAPAERKSSAGTQFGMSILFLILFTPCAFICWYRPVYKAFRSDSSFNFFMFFFVFFFQFCVNVIQAVGIDGWGYCGWIVGLGMVGTNPAVGAIMLIIALFFTLTAVAVMVLLIRVHRLYRNTGASFEKAQAEFASGVMSNKNVQNAAATAATSAVRNSMQPQGDNKY
ncbi:unnamed protein product [Owenia fusiformis]|uniref:Secretory carrier-associated membrane protein n=1 Tax=Owenia fusiformis TaxID=6347 RepID=A0A8J1TVP5_OWEFU|nr:unnamed protein product [Owenia fusiformis]